MIATIELNPIAMHIRVASPLVNPVPLNAAKLTRTNHSHQTGRAPEKMRGVADIAVAARFHERAELPVQRKRTLNG
jgi:hypothetical protein